MSRPYRMTARATASEATTRRILEAAQHLFGASPYDQVSLQAVAARAGVGVQTVLRRFPSKEQLFTAVAAWTSRQIRGALDGVPSGDVAGAIRSLIDTYERWGDEVLNRLAQEQRIPVMRGVTDAGRQHHYAWTERCLGPLLAGSAPAERAQRLAQLIAVTDLYVWKVLRRDLGLSRDEVEAAMRDLVLRLGPA